MGALAVKEKLASGSSDFVDTPRVIAVALLVADLHRESVAANDELASGQSVYAYVDNNPINFFDITGLAKVCSRPLNYFPGQLGSLRHDQIWYDDGTNSGFFNNDRIRPDQRPKSDYGSCKYIGEDDDVRAAETRVQKNWGRDWRLFSNNCQDYANAVSQDPDLIRERIRPEGNVQVGQ